MITISPHDERLTPREREQVQAIAERLASLQPKPRQPLSEGYRRAIEETFGSRGEGERDRWQP